VQDRREDPKRSGSKPAADRTDTGHEKDPDRVDNEQGASQPGVFLHAVQRNEPEVVGPTMTREAGKNRLGSSLPNAMATRRPIGRVKADCIARAFDGWHLRRELLPFKALRTGAASGKGP
jgi:hypothetical protein